MAVNAAVTWNFVAGTPSVADNVDQNFTDLVNWINTNAVHLDGSKAFTAVPTGPAVDPTSANQLARKAYVDSILPVGIIQPFAGSVAPSSSWLFCQGQAVSRSTYAGLFSVVGTAYGAGDGSTTFNLPNLQGRIPVGRDAGQTEFDVLGETGGAKTHTLVVGEMPSHGHSVAVQDNGSDLVTRLASFVNGGFAAGTVSTAFSPTALVMTGTPFGQYTNAGMAQDWIDSHGHGVTQSNAGGDGAHNNLQPYVVVNYLIKVL